MAIKPSGITIEDTDGDVLRFLPDFDEEYGWRLIVEDEDANAKLAINVLDAEALVVFLRDWLKSVEE